MPKRRLFAERRESARYHTRRWKRIASRDCGVVTTLGKQPVRFSNDALYLWTSNVTGRPHGPKRKLRAGYRTPSLQATSYLWVGLLCCASFIFYHRVLYRALSLRCARIWRSATILTRMLPLCQISFLSPPHCWVSPRRKIAYSVTHSPSLFDIPGTEAFASEFSVQIHRYRKSAKAKQWNCRQMRPQINSVPKRKLQFPANQISWLSDWVRDFSPRATSAVGRAAETKFGTRVA